MGPKFVEEMVARLRKKVADHEMDQLGVSDAEKTPKFVPADLGTPAATVAATAYDNHQRQSALDYARRPLQGEMKPTPRNPIYGAIADTLSGGRELLNRPGKVAGMGLGDLIIGDADKPFESLSYGGSVRNRSLGGSLNDQMPGVLDAALLPGAASLVAALRKGGTRIAETVAPKAVDMGRREALTKMGKGAAVAGAAAVSPTVAIDLLRSGAKVVAPEAVSVAAKTGVSAASRLAAIKVMKDMAEMFGGEAPKFEDAMAAAKKMAPDMSDEELVEGIRRSVGGYGVNETPVTSKFKAPEGDWMGLEWDELNKMGIMTEDDLNKAVFRGDLTMGDISPDVQGGLSSGGPHGTPDGPWSKFYEYLHGNGAD